MERTIKVTGKETLSVKPDTIRLMLTVEGTESDYEQVITWSDQQTQNILESLISLGFEKNELKTLSFQVNMEYESYQDEKNRWKQQFVGYKVSHSMKLEFPMEKERLGRILAMLAGSQVNPELHIHYTVKDPEAVKKDLLKKAVADAREKAEVMAEAAGVKLGEVLSMDYSFGEAELLSVSTDRLAKPRMLAESAGNYQMDMEPEDIEISDSVMVVWGIS